MYISIIIPHYNSSQYLKKCLQSINQSTFKSYEIISLSDDSRQGPAKLRNIGAQKAKGKILFFLDVDTTIQPDSLQKIITAFKKHPHVSAFHPQIDASGHFLSPLGFPYEIITNKFQPIFGAKSAALAIKKKVFNQINGFDPDYFIYSEDTDLCWRLWLAGYSLYTLPSVKITHFGKSSLASSRLFYHSPKNSLLTLLKNAPFKILLWILPLHLLTWLLISLKLLFQAKFYFCLMIHRGLFWNLTNLPQTIKKRRQIPNKSLPLSLLFGPLKLKSTFKKGLKWFKSL